MQKSLVLLGLAFSLVQNAVAVEPHAGEVKNTTTNEHRPTQDSAQASTEPQEKLAELLEGLDTIGDNLREVVIEARAAEGLGPKPGERISPEEQARAIEKVVKRDLSSLSVDQAIALGIEPTVAALVTYLEQRGKSNLQAKVERDLNTTPRLLTGSEINRLDRNAERLAKYVLAVASRMANSTQESATSKAIDARTYGYQQALGASEKTGSDQDATDWAASVVDSLGRVNGINLADVYNGETTRMPESPLQP